MKAVLAAAMLVLMPGSWATAQVERSDLTQALIRLERSVDALGPRGTPQLVQAVRWLRDRAALTNPAQVSPAYLAALSNAAVLLDGSPSVVTIDDVAADLEAKVEHCLALGIGMGGTVQLRVNTRRGSQTVNNWQVFYLLKFYERAAASSAIAFPTLSAPAETHVEPGRYWIWARDPETGTTSERSLFKVAGKQEFTLDLPVP